MATTYSTAFYLQLATTETLSNADLVAQSKLLHSGFDISRTLDGTTTPNITQPAYQTFTLVAGATTIDLTSVLLNGVAVSLDGLKPRAIRFHNTGAAAMTISKGAVNGYTGLGAAFSITLEPGQAAQFDLYDQGTAVSTTVKTFDISGTGTDTLDFSVVAGT